MPTPAGITLTAEQIANLRNARLSAGITQGALASQIGVSRIAVVAYEHGRARPGIDVLRAWAARVGFEVEEPGVVLKVKNQEQ